MANDITPYNNTWYAARALERLEKFLAFTKTVYREYDNEPRRYGQTIEIRKPGGFVAQQYPTNSAQDLAPSKLTVSLDQYWHVTYAVTSQELAYGGDRLIREHIDPAMQALAEQIEKSTTDLILLVGNRTNASSPAVASDLTKLRKALNKRSVPRANRYLALSAELDEELLNITQFSSANESSEGGETQREGMLGRKFGFNPYFQEILPALAASTIAASGTVAAVGAHAKGATQVTFDATTSLTGTIRKGFNFSFAGHSQQYAAKADATAAGNQITVQISPALQAAVADNEVVTLGTDLNAKSALACAYQSEAFGIITARLEDVPAGQGVEAASMVDPRTNIGIRVLSWFDPMPASGGPPAHYRKFEALWGVCVLDPNRAERYEDA